MAEALSSHRANWQAGVDRFVVEKRQADLAYVIQAHRPSRRFTGCLNGGQQQAYERPDDGHHDEELYQRKTAAAQWPAGVHASRLRHRAHANSAKIVPAADPAAGSGTAVVSRGVSL